MGREKRNLPAAVVGGPKERHKRAQKSQYDPKAPVPLGFIAKPAVPKIKHHSYYELVENKDKKKKLEHQVTTKKTPPPGFEFVPIGNPELTTACKELSRAKDAMIFIVSNSKDDIANKISLQVHRIGHHIREAIVEEARADLNQVPAPHNAAPTQDGAPEPIPKSQSEYDAQVDAALRDLFPRIPNTDRQMIIEHAFHRRSTKDKKPVGQSADLTLARRVQLAVLAHIRHTHTRYDELLRETSWNNARKVVERLCLDILVKWRGDEESGRDQLDEILREVVVISDSENEDSEEEVTDDSSVEEPGPVRLSPAPRIRPTAAPLPADSDRLHTPKPVPRRNGYLTPARAKGHVKKIDRNRAADKKGQRGFKRYQAWENAIRRNRDEEAHPQHSAMDRTNSQPSYQQHGFNAPPPASHMGIANGTNLGFNNASPNLPADLNGFIPRQPIMYGSSSANPPLHSNLAPSFQVSSSKVTPAAYEQPLSAPTSHRPMSPVTNRLQDLLVPSIEPPSPNSSLPSFVRALPPQRRMPVDHSPLRSSMHHRPQPVAPPRDKTVGDERAYFGRRVVSDYSPYGISSFHGFNASSAQVPLSRDQNLLSYDDRISTQPSPLYHSGAREPEPGFLTNPSAARRIIVDAPRPGERSNPILMEDRGGFFERIPSQAEVRPKPYEVDLAEVRRLAPGFHRATEPHRVVSWEEGSRILRESQGNAGVEIIPISGPHVLPPEARSHIVSADPFPMHRESPPNSAAFGRHFDGEIHPRHRPVSGEHAAPPPGPYWEEQRFDNRRETDTRHHHQPVYQRHRDEPLPMNYQHGDNRPPHRQPENVIVLE